MADDVVGGSLGHAERPLAVARVFPHALLLGAREERPCNQRAHDHQGDDREGQRHTMLVPNDLPHRPLLHVHECRVHP